MGRRMGYGVHMIPVPNVIHMRRRMWNVVEMGVLVVALCVCKLSCSEDCDCGQNNCARLKHLIFLERIAFQLRAALAAVRCPLATDYFNCNHRAIDRFYQKHAENTVL